ncbi:hypothetical protein AAG906_007443 [Vitis piasezkii]
MVTQPPIKGNLDCRARPFHSELCFDKKTFRHQPELRDSFHLLQRGTSTRSYLLRNELPPSMFLLDALLRHNIFPLQHMRRSTEEATKSDVIPLLFPRLLYRILEHLGYPSEPQLERRRLCREIFTLNKWTIVPATSAPHPSESSIAISISSSKVYVILCDIDRYSSILARRWQIVRAHHDQLIATRTCTTVSYIFNRSCHIEGNVQLGWGRVEEGSFTFKAKLFW